MQEPILLKVFTPYPFAKTGCTFTLNVNYRYKTPCPHIVIYTRYTHLAKSNNNQVLLAQTSRMLSYT